MQRPKRGETEEDILDFQERFLASGEQPAVSLVERGKRRQQPAERDVVQLGGTCILRQYKLQCMCSLLQN